MNKRERASKKLVVSKETLADLTPGNIVQGRAETYPQCSATCRRESACGDGGYPTGDGWTAYTECYLCTFFL